MGTKNNPGDFDCYEAAATDEPIFTLRANDPLAPGLVEIWAQQYDSLKHRYSVTGTITEEQRKKIQEARQCAEAMRVWKREQQNT